MRKTLGYLIGAVMIMVMVTAAPAQAAPPRLPAGTHIVAGSSQTPPSERSMSQCTDIPHFCLWSNRYYQGTYGAWATSVESLPSAMWNQASAFWNRLPGAVVFYTGDLYTGSWWCVDPGGRWDDLSRPTSAGWDNNIQSVEYYPGYTCA